ncbi:DUF4920 domain-containing protein [bacterium]|nr:DUF4920 domain-containing protein [bacterium]
MLKKAILTGMMLIVFSFVACSSEKVDTLGERYGQGVTLAEAISVNDVFTQAAELNGKIVRVSGSISDLCKHKGCWMQVSDGSEVLTVRFKDEAFILPADAAGKNVDFEGLFIAEKLSNPLVSHSACAGGGEHAEGESCEAERAEKVVQSSTAMRYTMVSTGLVLL